MTTGGGQLLPAVAAGSMTALLRCGCSALCHAAAGCAAAVLLCCCCCCAALGMPCGDAPCFPLPGLPACSHNFKFALPESFRVGTLDSLLGLSDDLAKAREEGAGQGRAGQPAWGEESAGTAQGRVQLPGPADSVAGCGRLRCQRTAVLSSTEFAACPAGRIGSLPSQLRCRLFR